MLAAPSDWVFICPSPLARHWTRALANGVFDEKASSQRTRPIRPPAQRLMAPSPGTVEQRWPNCGRIVAESLALKTPQRVCDIQSDLDLTFLASIVSGSTLEPKATIRCALSGFVSRRASSSFVSH